MESFCNDSQVSILFFLIEKIELKSILNQINEYKIFKLAE